jgi:hypothetical protein
MDVHERLGDGQFFPDADRALEFAEDRLLATLAPAAATGVPLELGQTLLGAGLQPDEVSLLASLMVERRYAKGEAVFRRGEPGDAMCVSLQGQIGIWLPAGQDEDHMGRGRRMVSFAPGVVFGEIGLLQGKPRSADAIAERRPSRACRGRNTRSLLRNTRCCWASSAELGLLLASRCARSPTNSKRRSCA